MNSRSGGEPIVGSELFYDTLTAAAGGHVAINDGHVVLAHSMVLDAKNLGSGQVAGHGNVKVRSTLGGALTLVGQFFDTGYLFPLGFGAAGPATFTGNLSFFGAAGGGQQTMGAATAGAVYGATEQLMLQTAYDVLRFFGFGT